MELSAEAVKELIEVLGSDNVIVDRRHVEENTRSCLPNTPVPDALVYARTVADVQSVLALARKWDVPVWTISTGKNWGYGEKSAPYAGGITLELSRMDKIIEVNEQLGYAIIEPGVTYAQLNDHIRAHAPSLWTDASGSTKDASVIGNALDKGRGLTPYADHFRTICGLDVVLADGRVMRTGGGPDNSRVWNLYKWGVGPTLDGLFAQSNLGVVVRAGVWLMPAPEKFDFMAFEYTAGEDKFPSFIDDFRNLVFKNAIRSHPHLANDFAMLCIVSQYPHELANGQATLSPSSMEAWRKKYGISPWTFGCGLYGSREEVAFQKRRIKKVFAPYGATRFIGSYVNKGLWGRVYRRMVHLGMRLCGKSPELIEAIWPAINLFRGIPTDQYAKQVYFKHYDQKPQATVDPARDGCGFIWIGPVVPFTGEDAVRAIALARPIFHRHKFDVFIELIVESPRCLIALFGVFYDKKSAEEKARAAQWYRDMREAFLDAGYPPYRVGTESMPHAFDRSPIFRDVLIKIKEGLDPDNILAPGRYGTPTRSQ